MQWQSRRAFLCSSSVEIPLYFAINQQFGVDRVILDVDTMLYTTYHCAAHRSVTLPETYPGSIIRIYTDDVRRPTGYVRLIRAKYNMDLLLGDLYRLTGLTMHGPAVLSDSTTIFENKYSLSIVPLLIEMSQTLKFTSQDDVFAVHSPCWPVEATE